ncbi:RdgB/HAM1 family non-canonical purine NTP pyrophosphatase [Succinivibrio dextrinosolvens]|jgi:XTP/dITP diphosphohydrolase|uniref:dITP/XTP pyrophosphatase n=1 Tax=Succinivibrio dextrinosolvens DSM 3072 TaxID=1123324 RepID=A0A1T4V0K7_9GAMM|nr:RdgB/HAM1 family non-canonical purine NTP pyrophosphatase [Succinivibrio dextrinosolvens]MBE6422215.1 RdgB/HAM1 family non-canonical purine NTP pyrophosphatase [Succinivibrio dextrinosolvens]SKA58424.1 XTP/dITP diphosphohydrolase [Succinivibrio dextrinosolvens DSM 3072]
MEKTIVLASANEGKAREFRAILEPLGFKIVLQSELGVKSPEETGKSFIENAILKARYAAEKTGMWALADDSGLSVDALNGAPGIYSARFSGGDDKSNNLKLLDLMKDVPSDKRTARYYCALCLVRHKDDPVPLTVLSSWEGSIGNKEIGSGGFGYDPLFIVTGRQCTAAQLPPQIKNLISHRGRALAALTYKLEHNLS